MLAAESLGPAGCKVGALGILHDPGPWAPFCGVVGLISLLVEAAVIGECHCSLPAVHYTVKYN